MQTPYPWSRRNRGFTLVELLIVVAIIGVLSTIAVPTFRRMISRSKQAEAKVALGAIYRVESAFRAEYEAYGNDLARMGFEIEGTDPVTSMHPGRYTIGFPDGSFGPFACNFGGTAAPDPSTTQGIALNLAFPAYYTPGGRSVYIRKMPLVPSAYCLRGTVAADGSSFTATASGTIRANVLPETTNSQEVDVWTMDPIRQLSHVNDGS